MASHALLRTVGVTPPERTTPTRPKNAEVHPREWLEEAEVTALMHAKARGRYGARDATMILLAYRHGLRVSELVTLHWGQIDWRTAHLAVQRLKGGSPSVHRLSGVELRALRALTRAWPESAYVFLSERGAPMTPDQFRKIVSRAGRAARFPFPLHPHMLRHGVVNLLCAELLIRQEGRPLEQHRTLYAATVPVTSCHI
jgi:type 1 fimbriae regulatory protein FimE